MVFWIFWVRFHCQPCPEVALRRHPAHQDRLQDDRGGVSGLRLTLLRLYRVLPQAQGNITAFLCY